MSLIGTFAFIKAFGFSINTLTLFGIVLATGLVVDDAIVVVENIARNLGETAGDARGGGQPGDGRGGGRGHRDLAGADRGVRAGGVSLRHDRAPLPAVLPDHRLLGGHLGVQRADAVARPGRASCCAREREHHFALFRWFNRGFDATRERYRRALGWLLHHLGWVGAAFVAGLALTLLVFRAVPTGFVPDEDQNYFIVQMIGPQGASLDYMTGVAKQVEARLKSRAEVQHVFSVLGFNFAGNSANRAIIFASLSPVGERAGSSHSAQAVIGDMQRKLGAIPGAIVVPFLPPPIQGQGSTGGFTFELLDKGVAGPTSARWRRRARV